MTYIVIYYFTYFSTVVPFNSCVSISCRPFVVNEIFSTGLVGVEVSSVSWLGQLTVGVQINVVSTMKGLQERNTTVGWDDGGKIGKIIINSN